MTARVHLRRCPGHSSPGRPGRLSAPRCAGEPALRREVEALLSAHADRRSARPSALDAGPTDNHEPAGDGHAAAAVGDRIGPYRLMEQIGEGGFGLVFVAEQAEPVRRKVALKVLKPGMDTRDVVARFEAERQALALMDHPNIAKVLDAGSTPAGRPYFVMELVRGVPITDYCDAHKLSPRSVWPCSCRSARPSSTRIRRGSSTATQAVKRAGNDRSTACRCPR